MMEHPVVEKAVQDNPGALAFLRAIAIVLHTWDDLVDRDHPVSDETISRCFWLALIALPRNVFYRENFDLLQPILMNSIVNWHTANAFERNEESNKDDLRIAFIVRSSYVDLLSMSALIIGGPEWAAFHGPEIRRWAHSEGFTGYIANLAAERAARKEDHVL